MSTSQQQFQNEHVTATVERHPGCQVRIDVAVSAAGAKAARQKAVKAVSREVSIPGFRKGKAPEALIVQNFGSFVDREWKDIVANTAFREVLQLTKIYPFTKDSAKSHINNVSINGASLIIEFEAEPEVPKVNPENLPPVQVQRHAVGEQEINQTLENLRLENAEWHSITDRPAAEGDYVDLDIDIVDEPTHNLCKDARFEMAQGKMGDWMRKLIIGLNPGESAEGMSEKNEIADDHCGECESGDHDHHHEHGNFEPHQCRITLKAILKPTVPETDNHIFLSKFGVSSADQLRQQLEKALNGQADTEHQQGSRKVMENFLLENYDFDIPESLLAKQRKEQKNAIVQELQEQGLSSTELAEQAEKIDNEVFRKLERDFKLYFLAQKMSADFHIEIRQDELMREYAQQILLSRTGQGVINLSTEPEELRSRLIAHLTVVKALDYLLEKAQTPTMENRSQEEKA